MFPHLRRFFRIRSIHWKLVASYFLVTALSVMLLCYFFLLPLAAELSKEFSSPEKVRRLALEYLPQFVPLLASPTLDPRMVQSKLEKILETEPENPDEPFISWRLSVEMSPGFSVAIANASGTVFAGFPSRRWSLDFPIQERLTEEEKALLVRLQAGERNPEHLIIQKGRTSSIFIPIEDADKKFLGIAFMRLATPKSGLEFFFTSLNVVFPFSFFIALGSGFVGIGAGFLITRGLMRRFDHIVGVTRAWSKGDFTKRIADSHRDELGDLSDQLNILAEDLDRLFDLRQRLASVSERNRIARDLHDTVKQHIFALSMQIKAVEVLQKEAPEPIQQRFSAIDDLIQQIQRDLKGIIQDLSVSENTGKTGVDLYLSFIRDWTKSTGIATICQVDETFAFSSSIDHILYPILQEGFSNILRHSHASSVVFRLEKDGGQFFLEIRDNGTGFDSTAVQKGMGLTNLKERAALLPDSSFSISSTPGKGTTLKLSWSEGGQKTA